MGVETAMAAAGIATSAISSGYSFIQANKERQAQAEAEAQAAKAIADARKELEVNYYDQLAIAKEPYDLARQQALIASTQAIEAGRESERGGVATAGRIAMANQDMQQKIQAAQAEDMYALNKLSAAEDSRLAAARSVLDTKEAEGAQKAAAQAEMLRQMYLKQGVQSAGEGLTSFAGNKDLLGLYKNFGGSGKAAEIAQGDAYAKAIAAGASIPEIPRESQNAGLNTEWMNLIQPPMGPNYSPFDYLMPNVKR